MILKAIPKKVIIYIVASAILLLVGAFGGYTFAKRANYKGVIKQQKKDAIAVLEHGEQEDVAKKHVSESIEKLRVINDPTGGLDKPSPTDYLNELYKSDRATQSEFD